MTPEHLCILRKTAGRVGAVFCILIAIVLVDSLISRFVYEFNVFYTQVDGQYDLTGVMPEKSEKMEDLVAETDSPEVVLEFSEVFSGFWLGNTMWRGKVRVSAKALPGEYVIKVRDARDTKINPALVFLAKVYPDALSLRKSHGPYLNAITALQRDGRRQFFFRDWPLLCFSIMVFQAAWKRHWQTPGRLRFTWSSAYRRESRSPFPWEKDRA